MVAVSFLGRGISEDHFVAERNSDGLGEELQVGGRRASYKWIAVGQRICLERQG